MRPRRSHDRHRSAGSDSRLPMTAACSGLCSCAVIGERGGDMVAEIQLIRLMKGRSGGRYRIWWGIRPCGIWRKGWATCRRLRPGPGECVRCADGGCQVLQLGVHLTCVLRCGWGVSKECVNRDRESAFRCCGVLDQHFPGESWDPAIDLSIASRWLACPGSWRHQQDVPDCR
jgi:hypothetical protein